MCRSARDNVIEAVPQAMRSVVTIEPYSESPVHSHPQAQWGVYLEGGWVRIPDGVEHHVKAGDF